MRGQIITIQHISLKMTTIYRCYGCDGILVGQVFRDNFGGELLCPGCKHDYPDFSEDGGFYNDRYRQSSCCWLNHNIQWTRLRSIQAYGHSVSASFPTSLHLNFFLNTNSYSRKYSQCEMNFRVFP